MSVAELTHEQRLAHWRERRAEHERQPAAGGPRLAELTDRQLLDLAGPGAELLGPSGVAELDPVIWRPCDPSGPLAPGVFRNGPLDSRRHPVPEHGPALVRFRRDGVGHIYAHKLGTARTYSYAAVAGGGAQSPARPTDDDALLQLVGVIAGDEPAEGYIEIRPLAAPERREFVSVGEPRRVVEAIERLRPLDVAVGIAPRARRSGTAADVERVCCLVADIDTEEAGGGAECVPAGAEHHCPASHAGARSRLLGATAVNTAGVGAAVKLADRRGA